MRCHRRAQTYEIGREEETNKSSREGALHQQILWQLLVTLSNLKAPSDVEGMPPRLEKPVAVLDYFHLHPPYGEVTVPIGFGDISSKIEARIYTDFEKLMSDFYLMKMPSYIMRMIISITNAGT
jgi:hypothetical protein